MTTIPYSIMTGFIVYLLTILFMCSDAQLQEDNLNFYLDSKANCRGVFDLSKRRAYIYGTGSRESSQTITDCYLTLKSETDVMASMTTLQIEVIKVKIQDSDVTFTIYDGGSEQIVMASYDVHNGKKQEKLFSTGNRVTFVLKRRNVQTSENQYDIELIVTPLYTGRDPDPGTGGGEEYIRFEKRIPTEAILGIVGGLLVVTVSVIVIVTVVCYRKHRGNDKPWEEHKLAYVNTGVSDEPRSANHSTRMWASQNSRECRGDNSHKEYSRRPPSYEDSVFDDAETLPRKRPVYHEYDKRSGNDYHSNHQAQDRPRRSDFRSRDDSFVQADDDHPQEMYHEKVIQPRVKTAPRRWVVENEDDDEVDEDEQPQRKNHWAEAGSADEEELEDGTVEQKEESEEEEDTEESEAEPSEEEDEEPQPPRNKTIPSSRNPAQPAQNPQIMAQPQQFVPQGRLPPVQIPPTMIMRAPAPQFVVYPVPVGPNQFQPVNPGGPPPQEQQRKPSSPKMKSRDPPTYSHLVQRGYNPQEGRDPQAGRSTPRSDGSDNKLHNKSGNLSEPSLSSGVEFMRR